MSTRSVVLARGEAPAGAATVVYTAPADTHVIVKSIGLQQAFSTDGLVDVFLVAGSGEYAQLQRLKSTDAGAQLWQPWFVLEAADKIQFNVQGGSVRYWLSGATLPTPTS